MHTPPRPLLLRLSVIACSALATLATCSAWAQPQGQAAKLTLTGHTDPLYAITFSPDGKLILTGSFDKTVRLWNAADGKELKKFEGHLGLVLGVAFSKDMRFIASASFDKT